MERLLPEGRQSAEGEEARRARARAEVAWEWSHKDLHQVATRGGMSRVGTRIVQESKQKTEWWLMVRKGREADASPGLGDCGGPSGVNRGTGAGSWQALAPSTLKTDDSMLGTASVTSKEWCA